MENDSHVVSLDPKYGYMQLVATQADHIYAELGDSTEPWVTVRGVEITGSFHMYLWEDGKWHIGPEYKDDRGTRVKASSYDQRQSAWIKRKDWLSRKNGYDMPSDSARDLLTTLVTERVNEWAATHQQDINRAEVQQLTRKIESQETTVAGCEKVLAEAQKELARLHGVLRNAQRTLRNGVGLTSK